VCLRGGSRAPTPAAAAGFPRQRSHSALANAGIASRSAAFDTHLPRHVIGLVVAALLVGAIAFRSVLDLTVPR